MTRPSPRQEKPIIASDERELVARIRSGDASAFEAVFHAYYRRLCNFMTGYVRSAAVAEEEIQDLLYWVWERRAQLDVRSDLSTYLYVAARNRAMNWLKHARVEARWQAAAAAQADVTSVSPRSADADVRDREIARALERAIAKLPERRRLAFTLAWQHGMSSATIATVMGISVKGVEVARARALEDLRKELAPLR